jgi:hypothetical protein
MRKAVSVSAPCPIRWVPEENFEALPARIKRAVDEALVLRMVSKNNPVSAWVLGEAWRSGELEAEQHIKNRDDEAFAAAPQNVECLYIFTYHKTPIVKVLRDKRDSPSPRVQFTLGGLNTKSTRDRLNRYAVVLGVKFYCWQDDNKAWALWVHDGEVFWEPLDCDDHIIATLY